MSSSKIQEYNLDPNCGFAKEETAQEILSQMGQGVTANVVKSVQSGVINMKTGKKPITATINAVNVEKSVVLFNGAGWASTSHYQSPWLQLTNSTTVSADSVTAGDSQYPATVTFTVLEFY